MSDPAPVGPRWRRILATPISQLLRGRITGAPCPLEKLKTSSLPENVVEAIRAITTQLNGRLRSRAARQLVNSCKERLLEGCPKSQLAVQLGESESIASLIRTTRTATWVLDSAFPACLWPTVNAFVGRPRFRNVAARRQLNRVRRALRWQLEAGRAPEELASKHGDAIALGGLIYETRSPGPLLDFDLPENLVSLVLDVVQRTRLWPIEKSDTARELCAHFADGLKKGSPPNELIESFGSPATSARLIRRACLRNRPLAWRAWRRTWQSIAVSMAIVLVLWSILATQFIISGKPTITFDRVQEFDDVSRAVPANERAWPLYRQGLSTLTRDERLVCRQAPDGFASGPEGEHWAEANTFLAKHADAVALFLDATSRPKMGFINRDPDNGAWLRNCVYDESYELNPPDLTLFETRSPQVHDLLLVSRMFVGETHVAVELRDGNRCLQLLKARLKLATHNRQAWPSFLCESRANWIIGRTARHVVQLVTERPELFENEQLVTLFRELASVDISEPERLVPPPRKLTTADVGVPDHGLGEAAIADFLQKAYTDDGNGNGRFTFRGFQILQRIAIMYQKKSWLTYFVPPGNKDPQTDAAEATTFQALAAPLALMVADRESMREELLRLRQLLWTERKSTSTAVRFTEPEYDAEYQRLSDSAHLRLKYLPALIIMPNERSQTWSWRTAENRVERDTALVVIAAERHRRRHGQFPETADELVPAFLSEVPTDPYTGKPLDYSVKEGRPNVDSVGLVKEDG